MKVYVLKNKVTKEIIEIPKDRYEELLREQPKRRRSPWD